jgi:hypothetical protein
MNNKRKMKKKNKGWTVRRHTGQSALNRPPEQTLAAAPAAPDIDLGGTHQVLAHVL